MGRLQRMKHELKAGWATLRYGAAKAAGRALEEAERLQLRLDIRRLDKRIQDLCGDIGERAVALHERGEAAERVLDDLEIARGAEQVLALKAERAKLIREMDETRSSD